MCMATWRSVWVDLHVCVATCVRVNISISIHVALYACVQPTTPPLSQPIAHPSMQLRLQRRRSCTRAWWRPHSCRSRGTAVGTTRRCGGWHAGTHIERLGGKRGAVSSCGSGEGSHVRLMTVVWCVARCHCLCCRGDDASRVAAELQVPHAIVGWYQVLLARAAQVHGLVQLMQEVRPLVVEKESFQVPAACHSPTTYRGGVTTPPNCTIPHQA